MPTRTEHMVSMPFPRFNRGHWRVSHPPRLPSLAAGVAVALGTLGFGTVEAYRNVRKRLWLRHEIELLPFPIKR
jgi:hypothetical protein